MKNRACGLLLTGLLFWTGLVQAQSDEALADEYFQKGEYEKAAAEYGKRLHRSDEETSIAWPLMNRYIVSLTKLKRNEEADKQLKKWAKVNGPVRIQALVLLASRLRDMANDSTGSNKLFEQAYDYSKNDPVRVTRLGELLIDVGATEQAIQALRQARAITNDKTVMAEELATLYRSKNNLSGWIETMLPLAERSDQRERVQAAFQGVINTKDEPELERVLYAQVQKAPESVATNEMLTWYYLQKQKFARALLQEKAMDKRLHLAGAKVFELAGLAMTNKEYKTAIDAYEYIITNHAQGAFYPYARRMLVNAREEQVKNTYPVEKAEIRQLIQAYQRVLSEVGVTPKTLDALRSSANLYANYLDEKDSAIVMLDQAIAMGKSDQQFVDKCKLDKGDVYLLKNEPWESTLLYSQVEKSEKDDLLGYEAKLRNAKLHYYKGDFTLAKSVLDVLKMATTREIANDAEQLSMLILDNTGLDSTENAMRDYAAIDLLLFQNKLDEASAQIDVMLKKYEQHTLTDELRWLQAKVQLKQNKIDEALVNLKTIVDKYPMDILADDALYEQAKIVDERKKDNAAALKLYEQLLTSYPGSVFAAESRKRIRQLRGDVIN